MFSSIHSFSRKAVFRHSLAVKTSRVLSEKTAQHMAPAGRKEFSTESFLQNRRMGSSCGRKVSSLRPVLSHQKKAQIVTSLPLRCHMINTQIGPVHLNSLSHHSQPKYYSTSTHPQPISKADSLAHNKGSSTPAPTADVNNHLSQQRPSSTLSYSSSAPSQAAYSHSGAEDSPHHNFPHSNAILDFDHTFSLRSTCSLLTSYAVLKSCSNPLILKHGPVIMEKAGSLALLPTKHTYYKYFVGGGSVERCMPAIEALQSEGIDVALDYSVEGLASESQADLLSQELIHSINFSGNINRENGKKICRFGIVKLTGIANTALLEKLSRIVEYVSCHHEVHDLQNNENTKRFESKEERLQLAKELIPDAVFVPNYLLCPEKSPSFQFSGVRPDDITRFTEEEKQELERLVQRLRRVGDACVKNEIPLLIDAEHTYYQSAIDYLAMKMHLEYTGSGKNPSAFPVIYNTYQNYLKDAKARMIHDYNFAVKENGLMFAAKLVRGAYMDRERQRAKELGIPSPINETIEDTHNSYNSSVEFGLDNIDKMGLFIATHNQDTLNMMSDLIVNKHHLRRNHDHIVFAQLYGMGDSLSLALSQAGFNVTKYMPYGPVEEVMPYLARRISENGDMFSGTAIETRRIAQELSRRIPLFH